MSGWVPAPAHGRQILPQPGIIPEWVREIGVLNDRGTTVTGLIVYEEIAQKLQIHQPNRDPPAQDSE